MPELVRCFNITTPQLLTLALATGCTFLAPPGRSTFRGRRICAPYNPSHRCNLAAHTQLAAPNRPPTANCLPPSPRVQAVMGNLLALLVPRAKLVPAVRPEDMSQDPDAVSACAPSAGTGDTRAESMTSDLNTCVSPEPFLGIVRAAV